MRRTEFDDVLQRHGGVIRRADALRYVSADCIDRAVASRRVRRLLPAVLVSSRLVDLPDARERAALLWLGPQAALSHVSALRNYGLGVPLPHDTVHCTVPAAVVRRSPSGFQVHRRNNFHVGAPLTVTRNERPLVRLERAIIESWPLLPLHERRAPAIVAVRERRTTPDRLIQVAAAMPNLHGWASCNTLLRMLADGCRSELELWGYTELFTAPEMPSSRGQYPVELDGGVIYVDRAFIDERVAVELDGRAYHSSPVQHEADLRRDAAMARRGWLTVRFTHERLRRDPHGCREELVGILAMRRLQLGIAS